MLTRRGLQYDRRYMLVGADSRFLSQREFPQMALFQTVLAGEQLLVFHRDEPGDQLKLPLIPCHFSRMILVAIWNDYCKAGLVNPKADQWFSEKLRCPCRLVYMPDSTERKVDPAYASPDDITSFSDAFPLLMVGQASLDDLNKRLESPIPMNRFRPNIVMAGSFPYQEDAMEHFRINGVDFHGAKLSARCVITTTDQQTGRPGKEPLKTLASYRGDNKKVYFGQNVLVKQEGIIHAGDTIHPVSPRTTPFDPA